MSTAHRIRLEVVIFSAEYRIEHFLNTAKYVSKKTLINDLRRICRENANQQLQNGKNRVEKNNPFYAMKI